MRNSARTVVIGDVHGCMDELQELLRGLRVDGSDRLISVGDLVAKGPDSRGVLEWAMSTPNLECILGNHELRLARSWSKGRAADGKPYDEETERQLGAERERYLRWLARLPLTVSGEGFTVVHAGFDPREELEWQPASQLTSLRRLDDGAPWYERYTGSRLFVFGHWARREPVMRRNAIGLDTGCVYGGRLTALILPERRLCSVPARREYARKSKWE